MLKEQKNEHRKHPSDQSEASYPTSTHQLSSTTRTKHSASASTSVSPTEDNIEKPEFLTHGPSSTVASYDSHSSHSDSTFFLFNVYVYATGAVALLAMAGVIVVVFVLVRRKRHLARAVTPLPPSHYKRMTD